MSLAQSERQPGRVLAALLAGAWRSSPPELEHLIDELPALTRLVMESGAASLVWRRVRNFKSLDDRVARELRQAYRHSTIQGELHAHEIKQAFTVLRSAGVEPVLVKGLAAAFLYPEPGLRPSGDIDLCVHPAQYRTATVALDRWTDHQFAVDLHEGFSSLDRESADDMFARSRLMGLGEVGVRVLAPEDHLRVLCMHFLRHGAFRPLWLCDIASAVESRPPQFDWDRCLGRDRKRRDWIACTVGLAHQLLDARVDDTPVERRSKELPGWFIQNVLKQWEAPNTMNHGVMRHRAAMADYLLRPSGVFKDLRNRWPNPIEATVYVGGAFNEFPRLPFQIGECVARTAKFFVRLPRLIAQRR